MKKKNINVIFQISERMNTLDFSILDDDLQAKICKVIAIFIDNAIECVNQSSYKYIWINFRKKNRNIIITIVNNYERKFDGDLLYVEGYTTKEKGHGIGLSIAKRIIDSDFRINNITKIIGSNFCQEIIIKMP